MPTTDPNTGCTIDDDGNILDCPNGSPNQGGGGASTGSNPGKFSDFWDVNINKSEGSGLLNWNNFNPKAESQWGLTTIGNVGGAGQPTFGRFNFGNTNGINSSFQGIGADATGGTLQNFNRAANRLRERVDALGKSQAQSGLNQYLGRGLGGPELAAQVQGDANREAANAFAQGLVDLEGNFEGFRQQGLQTALGAQSQIADLFGLGEQLRQTDQESYNNLTNNAFQSERDRLFKKSTDQAQITADEKAQRLEMLLKQAIERARLASGEEIAEETGGAGNAINIYGILADLAGSLGGEGTAAD